MPSLKYESIYKKALTMVNDLELATYTEEDFYDTLCEWLNTTSSLPLLRKKFSSYVLDDEIMELNFTLKNSVDDLYDTNFVKTILAKGIIINYFPSKLENTKNLATMIGGKEEKKRPVTRKIEKVGRNDECPCGSGKKYKQCCGNDN